MIKTVEVDVIDMGVVNPTVKTNLLDKVLAEWTKAGWSLFQMIPITDCRGSTCKLLLVFKAMGIN